MFFCPKEVETINTIPELTQQTESPSPRYGGHKIKLQSFEGPVDLLLYLCKKEEVDIFSFSILNVIDEYLSYIKLMQTLDLEVTADFVVMAAYLVELKSRRLLPRQEELSPEQEDEEMLRQLMMERLEEYKQYKQVVHNFKELAEFRERIYLRDFVEQSFEGADEDIDLEEVSLFDLLTVFKAVLARLPQDPKEIEPDRFTVKDRMSFILSVLNQQESCQFLELFSQEIRKLELIVTFLAILELIRMRKIRVLQDSLFGSIRVSLAA